MKKEKIIEFFNGLAPSWDADMIRDEAIIARILDGAGRHADCGARFWQKKVDTEEMFQLTGRRAPTDQDGAL